MAHTLKRSLKINRLFSGAQRFAFSYSIEEKGSGFDKRIFIKKDGDYISPWHDIALRESGDAENVFNAVFEISKYNIAKMECVLEETHNPLKQDTRKNKYTKEKELRYYAQFPLFNYGFLPQTWEDPNIKHFGLDYVGDGDPIDIVEIGSDIKTGDVKKVKVLGSLCLIDQDEIDWKLVTMGVEAAEEQGISNLEEFEKAYPSYLDAVKTWFKFIKTYDGKKPNWFEFDEKVIGLDETLGVINDNHKCWKNIMDNKDKFADLWTGN
mmetsp:Transcript_6356/g.7161  ORF Transcript_6356/g.7161 Transcript_6356/m.7161 type:complete len:266 (+) Transcript_6356:26-823(+)